MCREIRMMWKVNSTKLLFLLREWEQTKSLPALHSEFLGVALLFRMTKGIFASTKVTMTRKTDHCWTGLGWDHLMAEAIFLDVRENIGKPCIYNSNKDSGQRTFSSKNLVKLRSYGALQGQTSGTFYNATTDLIDLTPAQTEDHILNSFVNITVLVKIDNSSMVISHVGKSNQTPKMGMKLVKYNHLCCHSNINESWEVTCAQRYCQNLVWKYLKPRSVIANRKHTPAELTGCQSKRWEQTSVLPFLACPHEVATQNPKTNTRVNTRHVISAGTHNCAHPAAQCSPSLQEPTAGTQTTPSRK